LSRRAAILTCEKCGAEIPDGTSYCQRCGTPVSVAQLGAVSVPLNAAAATEISAAPEISAQPARLMLAGFWRRAVAYLLDTIIISLAFGFVASFYPSVFLKFPDATPSLTSLPQLTPAGWAITITATWVYYSLFEASAWHATLGKRVMGLYVADMSGRPLNLGRAAARNGAKLISSLTFLVGYLVAGFTEKKQALHDLLTSCLVLRRR